MSGGQGGGGWANFGSGSSGGGGAPQQQQQGGGWAADWSNTSSSGGGASNWAQTSGDSHGSALAPTSILHVRRPDGTVESLTVAQARTNIKNMGGEHNHIMDMEGLKAEYLRCLDTQAYHQQLREQHGGAGRAAFLDALNKKGVQ